MSILLFSHKNQNSRHLIRDETSTMTYLCDSRHLIRDETSTMTYLCDMTKKYLKNLKFFFICKVIKFFLVLIWLKGKKQNKTK